MSIKGTLIIIGGREDKGTEEVLTPQEKANKNIKNINREFKPYEILKKILAHSEPKKIEIITTGSTLPDEVKESYLKAFANISDIVPGFMHIKDRVEAYEKEYLERIDAAGSVFFSGGDQFRLATILGGTSIIEHIKKRYHRDKNFLVAGTSAGAMAMSSLMIAEGAVEKALIYRNVKIISGLGLIHYCIIDTHFINRGRFGRLAHAIIMNPEQLGIGLGEDTALIIKNGKEAECEGSGMVIIIDGNKIRETNIIRAKKDEPIYVENLNVHILVKGCHFSLKKRKLLL